MAQLTKEQMAAIDNYGSEIKTLKDFVTAVRKRPGMYIGHIGQKGVINMHREIYSNSIDQILAQDSPANWFSYYYNEATTEVRIEDNGKSLPFEHIIRIFTANHTSKNFEKKLYDYSSGVHGSGSKIVNALSTKYIVEAYHYDGTAVRMEFENDIVGNTDIRVFEINHVKLDDIPKIMNKTNPIIILITERT